MSAVPALLRLRRIDEAARDGNYCLVFASNSPRQHEGPGDFALARWRDGAWRFGNGQPLPFEPEAYQRRTNPEPIHA